MPITTLNDLRPGFRVSGSFQGTDVRQRFHDLVGETLGGRQILDAQVSAHAALRIHDGPLHPNETAYDRSVAKIRAYRGLQSVLSPNGEVSPVAPRINMDSSTLNFCPDASKIVPPPKLVVAHAESRDALRLTIDESVSVVGKRVETYFDLHYSGLIVEVCPQDANGKWMVNAANGVACVLHADLGFSQKIDKIENLRISLSDDSVQSLDFHRIVFRLSWAMCVAPIDTPPTKANVCAATTKDESTSGMINVHQALYDPSAVADGGGREFVASMVQFEDAATCLATSTDDENERATKRMRMLAAAEARIRSEQATSSN